MSTLLSSPVLFGLVVILSGCATKESVRRELVNDVVNNFASLIEQHYVYPEKLKILSSRLKTSLGAGEFYKINSEEEFVQKANEILQSVSNDKHLYLHASAGFPVKYWFRKMGHLFSLSGIKEVSILDKNIGYMKMRNFRRLSASQSAIESAMEKFSDTKGMIIDLCGNSGGEPETVAFLASYFFD